MSSDNDTERTILRADYSAQLHVFASDERSTPSGLRGALHDAANALEAQAELSRLLLMTVGRQKLWLSVTNGLVLTLAVAWIAHWLLGE